MRGIDTGEDLREHLDDGDARAERREQARELAADDATADHQHVLGDALQAKDAVGGDHAGMLHVDAGQPGRLGADADDEVVELVAFVAGDHRVAVDDALRANDLHAACACTPPRRRCAW